MNIGSSEIVRNEIFKIIKKQIKASDPPETKKTLKRLMGEGYSKEDSMKLIGAVVASQIWGIVKEKREYDQTAYIKALSDLPRLPGE